MDPLTLILNSSQQKIGSAENEFAMLCKPA